jgi:hypothetical protein
LEFINSIHRLKELTICFVKLYSSRKQIVMIKHPCPNNKNKFNKKMKI